MSLLSIVRRSLLFHWRIHAAVALGVAAAAAVLTGALLVGDSVRGSLRFLALDRLGRIDELLIVDRFFREELADELVSQPEFTSDYSLAVPAILFPSGTVEAASRDQRRRAGNVLVIGAGDKFWQLGDQRWASVKPPGPGEIVLNGPLAEELAVKAGEQVTLRLDKGNQIPADSPLGQKSELVQSLPSLTVSAIVPSESLGRFSLSPMQTSPRNAYVSLATVQEGLDAAGKANAIFVAGNHGKTRASKEKTELTNLLQPRLADLGLTLKHVRRTFTKGGSEETVLDYFSLSSDRMMLDAATEREALATFGDLDPRPALTYLANEIKKVEPSGGGDAKGIPYSTITAIDPSDGGPLIDASGKPLPPLAADEIVLTSWAAEDQGAQVGDRIRVTYFEPETTHGEEREASAEFRVAAIVPLTTPSKGYTRRDPAVFTERPTTANDPDLTPEVKGITDQASIDDWDPPFPMDNSRLRDQDDTYWEHYRTTPKAYVSLAAGQKLWGSRFGKVTSIRIPAAPELSVESLERQLLAQLQKDGERLGMEFQPLKAQAIAASAGTTPFDVLFLLLSMFIIAAALLLVWLLFRLGVEQRAGEIGTLLAMGWTRQQVGRLLLAEGLSVSSAGALLGVVGGVGYAWLMLAGLRSWWIGAIASPFLTLYVTPLSLVLGFALALIISGLTIWLGVRGLRRVPARQLMAGVAAASAPAQKAHGRRWRWLWLLVLVAAIGLSVFATRLGGEMQAIAFLASGALVLVAILLVAARMLRENEAAGIIGGALAALVVRNAGRNLSRSITTIALMAAAAFLIVAVSSFRLSPTERGTGGFDLIAESSQSVIADLNSPTGRQDLFAADAATLEGTTILAFRVKAGDDASCRNLYQPSQPRVLGVSPAFVAHFDNPQATPFGWAASAALEPQQRANPWLLLSGATPADEPVPVILDKTTAMYSLKLYRGIGEEFTFTYDERTPVKFRVVGLLDNSLLQGSLLVSEANFVRLFPQSSGYRSFLLDTPAGHEAKVTALLEDRLGDEGFDAADTRTKLADLLAVQNTYISTFQSLGAIGLLLGTFGVAAARLRSVFERRQELALMRATGFRAARLGRMVLLENLLLLIGGLAAGSIAALVTVLPHMLVSGARVPLVDLAAMLGVVLVVGVITGLLAVRATLDAPLVAALRGE